MTLRNVTIGLDEPALWAAVALATILGIVGGASVGSRVARQPAGIIRWATAAWLGVLLVVGSIIVAYAALSLIFSVRTGGAMVCTFAVGWVLRIPGATALLSEAMAWRLTSRRAQHAV